MAYGRCVGHGGMPVDLTEPDPSEAPVRFYDSHFVTLDNGTKVGRSGFVNVTIENDQLTLEYRDIDNTLLLVERFTPGANGELNNIILTEPGILHRPTAS